MLFHQLGPYKRLVDRVTTRRTDVVRRLRRRDKDANESCLDSRPKNTVSPNHLNWLVADQKYLGTGVSAFQADFRSDARFLRKSRFAIQSQIGNLRRRLMP